jgi:hypothetical protein
LSITSPTAEFNSLTTRHILSVLSSVGASPPVLIVNPFVEHLAMPFQQYKLHSVKCDKNMIMNEQQEHIFKRPVVYYPTNHLHTLRNIANIFSWINNNPAAIQVRHSSNKTQILIVIAVQIC